MGGTKGDDDKHPEKKRLKCGNPRVYIILNLCL